ncbi:MAG: response regulator [Sphingobacteriales bacterium]|nr:response regulator [Sphingobacteriales bacterium]
MNSYRETYNYPSLEMAKDTDLGPQALIIDDEVDICYLLKGILRQRNIQADHVTSLAAADTFLKETNPPVIFLDNHLSDGLGIDYVRRLKENHPLTKVIMITAHDTAHDRERAFNEGVDFFISKPFSREMILRTIEKISM